MVQNFIRQQYYFFFITITFIITITDIIVLAKILGVRFQDIPILVVRTLRDHMRVDPRGLLFKIASPLP